MLNNIIMKKLQAILWLILPITHVFGSDLDTNPWLPIETFNESDADRPAASLGVSLAKSSDTLVLGSDVKNFLLFGSDPAEKGNIVIYHQEPVSSWQKIKILAGDNSFVGDLYGDRVSLMDDLLFVASAEAVYMYEKNTGGNNHWGRVNKLTIDRPFKYLSASSDILLLFDANEMSLLIYERDFGGENAWGKILEIEVGSYVFSASIEGEIIVIGLPFNGDGRVNIYQKENEEWPLITSLQPEVNGNYSRFGYSVAIDGPIIALASYRSVFDEDADDDDVSVQVGLVEVYERDAREQDVWLNSLSLQGEIEGLQYYGPVALEGSRFAMITSSEDDPFGDSATNRIVMYEKEGNGWNEFTTIPVIGYPELQLDSDSILAAGLFFTTSTLYGLNADHSVSAGPILSALSIPSISNVGIIVMIVVLLLVVSIRRDLFRK